MKLLTLLTVLLAPTLLFAQPRPPDQGSQERAAAAVARMQDLQRRHTTTVRGSENPSALPRGQTLELFFLNLAHEAPRDDSEFGQFAIQRFGATGSDAVLLKEARDSASEAASHVDICLRVLDGSLPDGASIASYITQVDQQLEKDTEAHYQSVIDKLSPATRSNLLNSVNESSANVANSTLDHLGMAQEDPVLYKSMMTGLCNGRRSATSLPRTEAQEPSISAQSQR